MSRPVHFSEICAAVLSFGALAVVAYAAIAMQSEQSLGTLQAVVAAAVGFFLRGRLQHPT